MWLTCWMIVGKGADSWHPAASCRTVPQYRSDLLRFHAKFTTSSMLQCVDHERHAVRDEPEIPDCRGHRV